MAVFLVGFGAGELSLVVLRWLALTSLPTVMFLLLLLVGMPIGGVLLIRNHRLRETDFPGIIVLFGTVSLLCVPLLVGVLSAVRPPLPDVATIVQGMETGGPPPPIEAPLTLISLFPLFVAYGIVEFAAYRAGLAALQGQSGVVYALNLGGLLVSFVAHRFLLEDLATPGLFFLGIAALAAAILLLVPRRWLASAALLAAGGLLFWPGLEHLLISVVRTTPGPDSLAYWKPRCDRVLYDRWTPQCRLTLLEKDSAVFGFYNGAYYWAFFRGLPGPEQDPGRYRRLDLAFTRVVRPGDKVAVIGAGGGVHVAEALRAGAGRVVAVDVVPEVLELASGPLAEHFDRTYCDPRVQLVAKNGRRFLGESQETFDLIILARLCSHVTGLREMLEPSQLMFTREAFQSIQSRLKPGGVLIISDNLGLDRTAVTFAQNYRELQQQGYRVVGFLDAEPWKDLAAAFAGQDEPMPRGQYVIVAQTGPAPRDAIALVGAHLRGASADRFDEPPPLAGHSPGFTDDRAFATGVLVATLGYPLIAAVVGFIAVMLGAVAPVLAILLRRTRSDSAGCGQTWLSPAAVVVGLNFMSLEYLMVYRWMHHLDITVDATFVGMVVFAGLAAVGGALLVNLPGRLLLVLNGAAAVGLLATAGMGPPYALLAIVVASFMSGSLFPRLLWGSDRELVRVYAWDAYGTLWGGLGALCVPLFFGFALDQRVAAVVLLAAAALVYAVQRSRGEAAPEAHLAHAEPLTGSAAS